MSYQDRGHYRIPEPDGLRTVYGLMTFDFGAGGHAMLGFSSCKRFVGRFSFDARRLRISVDPENLELAPGESWDLEEFMVLGGENRQALLDQLADRIAFHHPPLPLEKVPTGWCSWYCYWDKGTQAIVHENMMAFRDKLPEVRFIQIDDGYSPTEGD
jgi:alpha-galactosidase